MKAHLPLGWGRVICWWSSCGLPSFHWKLEYSIPGGSVTTHRLGFPWQDLFVFVLQLALSFSSPLRVYRFGEKSLLVVKMYKIFPADRCSGLTEDPWANAYVLGRKLKLLLRLLSFLCRSPTLQADSLPAEPRGKHKNTGVGSLSLLQRIFPTQESNLDLPHCRQILYQLSHKGSTRILEWVVYPFSSGSSRPRNWTWLSCVAGGFFTDWATDSLLTELPGKPICVLISGYFKDDIMGNFS